MRLPFILCVGPFGIPAFIYIFLRVTIDMFVITITMIGNLHFCLKKEKKNDMDKSIPPTSFFVELSNFMSPTYFQCKFEFTHHNSQIMYIICLIGDRWDEWCDVWQPPNSKTVFVGGPGVQGRRGCDEMLTWCWGYFRHWWGSATGRFKAEG